MPDPELEDRLRALPSVEELLQAEPFRSAAARGSRASALEAARGEIDRARARLREGNGTPDLDDLASAAAQALEQLESPSLTPVINATGVIVHTNLGRAPLAEEALVAVTAAGRGYSNLEYELEAGARGSRHVHVEQLICELTGAEAGFAVNNNAAAVLLALAALAPNREVVISRGQLIEIGGSFRIPEILAASGARLVEVGTTNKTRPSDYEQAIGPDTGALMRVHCSNFKAVGFTEEVEIEHLCALGAKAGLPVIDDLGSGVLDRQADVDGLLRDEPPARRSIDAGVAVACFSADKLLGGPQAGVVAGRAYFVESMRAHPLARALRIDKLSLAALEATLRLHRDARRAKQSVPVLRMLGQTEEELGERATRLADSIVEQAGAVAEVAIVRASGRVGGGALPLLELEGPVVSVKPRTGGLERLAERLRQQQPPVVARTSDGALLLDPRTISDAEVPAASSAVAAALR